ncbi:hypothetical protein JCM8097_008699 [Rhodosporidiobolus ruineniae]
MGAPSDPLESLTHAPQRNPYVRNWSSTYNTRPSLLFCPVSTAEVQLILKEATARGKKVRVVGEHASPGPIWHGEWLISTRHFTLVHLSPPTRTARLGAGVTLRKLNPFLASHGLAFPNQGSISDVSIGAYFSGPDHGSSAYGGICPTFARAARIVLPTGEVVETRRGEDLFRAVGTGVGAVGVVVEVEWELEEAFGVEVTMERIRLKDYLEDDSGRALWELARSREYVKIWHFPHSFPAPFNQTDTILWRGRRTALPPPQSPSLLSTLKAYLIRIIHAATMLVTLYLFPGLQGWVNGILFWLQGGLLPKTQEMRSYEAFEMDCMYNQLVNEWTVPLPSPSTFRPSPSASHSTSPAIHLLRSLLSSIHPSTPRGRALGMHAPVEIRFNRTEKRGEEFFLSPGASVEMGTRGEGEGLKEDLVMWVEPIVYRPLNLPTPPRFLPFFQHFEALFRAPGMQGRPHWCKAHFPSSVAEVERMFTSPKEGGETNLETFHRVRLQADPEGTMWSQWLEERVPTPLSVRTGGGKGEKEGEGKKSGTAHGESEREAKRSGRWEDVMGSSK